MWGRYTSTYLFSCHHSFYPPQSISNANLWGRPDIFYFRSTNLTPTSGQSPSGKALSVTESVFPVCQNAFLITLQDVCMPMVFACLRRADTGDLISSSVGLSPQFLNTGSEYYSFKMLKSPPDTRALFWKYPFPICTLLFWYLLDLHVALLIGYQVFTWSNVAK